MIKNGFTLAEVLITLAIIGIVAALTVPTLMTDSRYQLVSSRVAKFVSVTEDAAMAKAAMDGTINIDTFEDIILYKQKTFNDGCRQYEFKDGTTLCVRHLIVKGGSHEYVNNPDKYGTYVLSLEFAHNVSGIDNFKPILKFGLTDKGYVFPMDNCTSIMFDHNNNNKTPWKLDAKIANNYHCKNNKS